MAPVTDYETLVQKHARVMSSAIRRVLGRRNEALVPDIEQEVRLALWKRIRGGKKIDHPVSYVYKAARTTALGVMKHQPSEAASLDDGSLSTLKARQTEERHHLLPVERTRLLEQMLEQLSTDQSRALRGYLTGMNHLEVARLYGWSESVARHRIYRGMEALKSRARLDFGDQSPVSAHRRAAS